MLAQAPALAQARRLASILNFQASVFPHVDDPLEEAVVTAKGCSHEHESKFQQQHLPVARFDEVARRPAISAARG